MFRIDWFALLDSLTFRFIIAMSMALTIAYASAVRAAGPLAQRQPDPIVLVGAALGPALTGVAIDDLVLLASDGHGDLQAIPYQFDERTADGEFVLTGGSRVVEDIDRGRLDDNDELVFLARDAGLREPLVASLGGAMAEIRVRDPHTGQEGWVYLTRRRHALAPAFAPFHYMEYDRNAQRITTPSYQIRFTDPERPFTRTWTSMPKGAGDPGVDFLDSAKLRMTTRFLGMKSILRTDRDFESTDHGYKIGPVRLIRVVETRLRMLGQLASPGAKVVRIYYPDWMESPVPIHLPFKISSLFSNTEIFFGNDFDLPRDGSHRYYSDLFPSGIPIGGASSEVKVLAGVNDRWEEPQGSLAGIDVASPPPPTDNHVAWQGVAGPLGASFSAVRLPESVPVKVKTVFRVSEDEDANEDVRGAAPLVGRRLVDWDDVPGGQHLVHFYDFFPRAYQPGDEQKFITMLTSPLDLEVHTVGVPESAATSTLAVHAGD